MLALRIFTNSFRTVNDASVMAGARVITLGGVIAYPTEGCFGIGCDPSNPTALRRVLRIKKRPKGMGLILIAHQLSALLPYLDVRDVSILEKPKASWPGPYTWVFPLRRSQGAQLFSLNQSVAVRVTDHPIAARLCYLFGGAIVSTSANRHGQAPIRRYNDAARIFRSELDWIVRGAIGPQKKPTQIADARSGRLIRAA